MKKLLTAIALIFLFVAEKSSASESNSSDLVVVSIRYLKAEGVSHARLYLYKENGKFLRQLTHGDKGQDHNPLFSEVGKTIVFTRTSDSGDGKNVVAAKSKTPSFLEYWQVGVDGTGLMRLAVPPDWYESANDAEIFNCKEPRGWPKGQMMPGHPDRGWGPDGSTTTTDLNNLPVTKVLSPGDGFELVLKLGNNDLQGNGPGNGELYELRNLKNGMSTRLGTLPNFLGLTNLLHRGDDSKTLFLMEGMLQVAFFDLHLGSTDGDTVFALDLKKPQLAQLSPNNCVPIPLPGEQAFLTLGQRRYFPIPGSKKTANCSMLSHWNADMQKVDYCSPDTAPNFYGASLFRQGMQPTVLKISENIWCNFY